MPSHYKGTQEEVRALKAYITLLRSAESLSSSLAGELAGQRLTLSQFGVLEALFHLGPMSPSALAGKLLKSGGNMTMVVGNLEKRKLVRRVRDRKDRRTLKIHLTAEGRRMITEVLPEHVQWIRARIGVLTEEEQENLRRLCKKVGRGAVS
ncbi:MAG: MarR family winged helix-turn-helix transcriptional regulator [Acidobacteriota bacterium]